MRCVIWTLKLFDIHFLLETLLICRFCFFFFLIKIFLCAFAWPCIHSFNFKKCLIIKFLLGNVRIGSFTDFFLSLLNDTFTDTFHFIFFYKGKVPCCKELLAVIWSDAFQHLGFLVIVKGKESGGMVAMSGQEKVTKVLIRLGRVLYRFQWA